MAVNNVLLEDFHKLKKVVMILLNGRYTHFIDGAEWLKINMFSFDGGYSSECFCGHPCP